MAHMSSHQPKHAPHAALRPTLARSALPPARVRTAQPWLVSPGALALCGCIGAAVVYPSPSDACGNTLPRRSRVNQRQYPFSSSRADGGGSSGGRGRTATRCRGEPRAPTRAADEFRSLPSRTRVHQLTRGQLARACAGAPPRLTRDRGLVEQPSDRARRSDRARTSRGRRGGEVEAKWRINLAGLPCPPLSHLPPLPIRGVLGWVPSWGVPGRPRC